MNNNVYDPDPADKYQESWESMQDGLKERINNLLWCTLPPAMTLDSAENIAVDIFDKIRDEWEKMRKVVTSNAHG